MKDLGKYKKTKDDKEKIVISSVAIKVKHKIFIAASDFNLSEMFRDFLDDIMKKDSEKKSS